MGAPLRATDCICYVWRELLVVSPQPVGSAAGAADPACLLHRNNRDFR
jgi:hypothetical protein